MALLPLSATERGSKTSPHDTFEVPDMSDAVARLLAHPGVRAGAPDPAAVRAVAERFGPLPPGLVALWLVAGRVEVGPLNATLLGPADVLELADGWDGPASAGLVLVLDTHESNYLMVAVRGPLAPRVVWAPHDDAPRVLYRDFGGILAALAEALGGGTAADVVFRDAPGDYGPDAPRTAEDRAAGRALLDGPHDENEWNFAVQLLGAADLPEWERLLNTDHFVRRDAVDRLGRMTEPACRALLARSQRELAAFGADVAAALRAAGVDVGERQGDTLRVGGQGYMLDGFFPAGTSRTPCHGWCCGCRTNSPAGTRTTGRGT